MLLKGIQIVKNNFKEPERNATVSPLMTNFMYVATLAWVLLLGAYVLRQRRWLHVPLAVAGMLLDVMLVVHLQLTRDAVQKAASLTLGALEQIHIVNSSIALLLYLPVFYLGALLILGRATVGQRAWHLRLAISALIFRTLGFLFMLSFIK